MRHKVYFEIFGKKIKVSITSSSKEEAVENVRNSIKIYKVEKEKENSNSAFGDILNILGL